MIRIDRDAFNAGVREAFWQFLAALAIGLMALIVLLPFIAFIPADAAVLPRAETPLTSTSKAKEARRPTGQCIEVQTIRRFLVRPGGKWVPLTGEISMLVPCS